MIRDPIIWVCAVLVVIGVFLVIIRSDHFLLALGTGALLGRLSKLVDP